MPRIKRKAKPGRTQWYAPNIDDNRKTREFEVFLEPMTGREFVDNVEAQAIAFEDDASGRVFKARDATLRKRIKAVRGYVTIDDETGERTDCTTADQLIKAIYACEDAQELKILDDCLAALQDASHLDKGLKKSSEPVSGSKREPPPMIPSGDGDADCAAEKSGPHRLETKHADGETGVAEFHPARMAAE